jgi:SAM-dependent methyltransferase
MLSSLNAIYRLKTGDIKVLKAEKWLMYLAFTSEQRINLEYLQSMDEKRENIILNYTERTLNILSDLKPDPSLLYMLEETLKWSEVAKSGLPHQRSLWLKKGYNLFAHNIGSAQIYFEQSDEKDPIRKRIIHTLISTHGLIGQYIRGEVPLVNNKSLTDLAEENLITPESLSTMLSLLNRCIISSVNQQLWQKIQDKVATVIQLIINGRFEQPDSVKNRICSLRAVSIKNGENFEDEFVKYFSDPKVVTKIEQLITKSELWYVEAALYDFTFEEFIKIFLLIACYDNATTINHISFEHFMNALYYQHDGKKRINIYKKRIIEKYLSALSFENIMTGCFKNNPHVQHTIRVPENLPDTIFFTFDFSAAGSGLIDFCIEAEKSDVLYESAIILLFDLFGLRKDKYDRFYEEERYLSTMNQTINYKKVILDYITGNSVIDIGPGGGALLDLIEETFPDKKVTGVDIAQNVLDTLKKKKQLENKKWDVLYGDALNLIEYIDKETTGTIIFSSILHELFSYIEYNGRKFNHETLKAALNSAFEILTPGGRIIIRDGIMTEPIEEKRIIRFMSEEGMAFLKRYAADFKGREIQFTIIGQNEVLMPVNDAMEFLYTYTWGDKSYVHEVNEQFGYFTPSDFRNFIKSTLGNRATIIEFKHYLQDGYTIALSQKIELYNEDRKPIRLPDSTCIAVIEKCRV